MRKIIAFLFVLSFALINMASNPHTAAAAGSASVTFYCNAVVVSGTTDQAAVRVSVIVSGTGVPGVATAGPVLVSIPGSGSRPFNVVVPVSLTHPAPPYDTTSTQQFIYVVGLDSGGVQVDTYVATQAVCSGSLAGGPPIPGGFVLRTITCNTAVFNTPGGQPLASGEKITAGQTWYVSPTSVKDAKGNSWTEIFNSGVLDGFIWTSCVGGAPAK